MPACGGVFDRGQAWPMRFTHDGSVEEEPMKVERIYTPNVVGVARADTVQEAAATMRRFHVGSLLVVEGQRRPEVVGIVTDRDLVLLSLAEGVNMHKSTVDTVMSPVVATVS